MAVWRPQTWHAEYVAVGTTQLLHIASLQTLLSQIAMQCVLYITKNWERPLKACKTVGLCQAFLADYLLHHNHIFTSVCTL